MTPEATFYGGSVKATLSAEYHLSPRGQRLAVLDPTATLYAVRLSDARQHRLGCPPPHAVANSSGADTLTVKDKAGNTLTTVGPGKVREFELLDNATQAGEWWAGPERAFTQGGALS